MRRRHVAQRRWDEYADFVLAWMWTHPRDTVPHLDSRILHDPRECAACDIPALTAERRRLGIAFTGHRRRPGQVACEAEWPAPGLLAWIKRHRRRFSRRFEF
jgi:hypothetical protein